MFHGLLFRRSALSRTANLSGRVSAREDLAVLRAWLDEDHVLQDAQAQVGKNVSNKEREGEREKDASKDTTEAAKDSPGTAADPAEPPEQVDLAAEAAVDPAWRSNMLIQILLRAGQASPTHTFVYLDRCVEDVCENFECNAKQITLQITPFRLLGFILQPNCSCAHMCLILEAELVFQGLMLGSLGYLDMPGPDCSSQVSRVLADAESG